MTVIDFTECATCAAKPGATTLCESCLRNRHTIERLKAEVSRLQDVTRGLAASHAAIRGQRDELADAVAGLGRSIEEAFSNEWLAELRSTTALMQRVAKAFKDE